MVKLTMMSFIFSVLMWQRVQIRLNFYVLKRGCPFPELVQTMPHIAYEVESMDEELKDAKLIYGPFIPVPGMTVAFIEEEGIPVKLDYFS